MMVGSGSETRTWEYCVPQTSQTSVTLLKELDTLDDGRVCLNHSLLEQIDKLGYIPRHRGYTMAAESISIIIIFGPS